MDSLIHGESMIARFTYITLLVSDQDQALRFYTEVVGLQKRADRWRMNGTRWLTVAPVGQSEEIALVQAETSAAAQIVGQQAVEHPLFVLQSSDFDGDRSGLSSRGVVFVAISRNFSGRMAHFVDLYGNVIGLVEARAERPRDSRSSSEVTL